MLCGALKTRIGDWIKIQAPIVSNSPGGVSETASRSEKKRALFLRKMVNGGPHTKIMSSVICASSVFSNVICTP